MHSVTVLGLNVWHDRAACIVENGKVIVAIAEERLDRVKHSLEKVHLPSRAISYCCAMVCCELNDFDAIVITSPEREITILPAWIEQLRKLGLKRYNTVHTLSHHLSHAYSTYFMSSFDQALIWIADGAGSFVNGVQEAESAYLAQGFEIKPIWTRYQGIYREETGPVHYPLSLGRKYDQVTDYLGFHPAYGQCGKTMALASYGDSNRFSQQPLGWIDRQQMLLHLDSQSFVPELDNMLACYPIPDFKDELSDVHGIWADVSAHFQEFLENALVQLIGTLIERYQVRTLCLAGGVALNCVANTKIVQQTGAEEYFIQPASGDDGQALGAALFGYYAILKGQERYQMKHAYLGRDYSPDIVKHHLVNYPHFYHFIPEDLESTVALCLAENRIVAWFQGGAEFRATCVRSS